MLLKKIHLELTNKCTLKCPRCARTSFIDKFGIDKWTNKDLSFQDLVNFLDVELENLEFLLCGNEGDPIYYPELFNLVSWIKSRKSKITLITNGSYKSESWWKQLISYLSADDTVIFSIDGTPENFLEYRINADWESIETGIKVVTSSNVKSVWKYIPFSFNEDSIESAKAISEKLGFNEFNLTPSDRWEPNDYLKPNSQLYNGDRTLSMVNWQKNGHRANEISPKCASGQMHYISASGFYMPCCFVGDWRFYFSSEFHKNKNLYDIKNNTLSNVLKITEDFYKNITTTKPKYCTFNCPTV